MAITEKLPGADAPVVRVGWQCPGCRTHYSPDVQECRCEARGRSLAERLKPQAPIQLGGALIRFPPAAGSEP